MADKSAKYICHPWAVVAQAHDGAACCLNVTEEAHQYYALHPQQSEAAAGVSDQCSDDAQSDSGTDDEALDVWTSHL
jgi:pyridoxine/pyridoxamine 5'-phosphate oxidase